MKKIMIKNPVLVRFGMILVLALAISSIVSSFFLEAGCGRKMWR